MQINDVALKSMGMGRIFKDNSDRINSIDFHRVEDLLVTASDDDSIHLYNTVAGTKQETLFSRKYGVSNVVMTHASSCILYATRKAPPSTHDPMWYSVRYHDIQHNEYIRYFKGHTAPITTVAMSPKDDTFMSAALDKTLRLWDLRSPSCAGIMNIHSTPSGVFDQQGLVFACAVESGVVKLYDVRSYDKGPFDTFVIQEEVNSPATFTDLKFSNNGKYLLGVVDGRVYVLDAFEGSVVCKFGTCASQESPPPLEAAFSPDSQYVVAGCDDRSIKIFSVTTGQQVAALPGHAGLPMCVKFAPKRMLIASACQALVLWIPPLQALDQQTPGIKPA